MKKSLIIAVLTSLFSISVAQSQNYSAARYEENSDRVQPRFHNGGNFHKIEEVEDDEKTKRVKRTGIRNDHARMREKIRSLSPEQRKALRQEQKRHRKAMKEIMGQDFEFSGR